MAKATPLTADLMTQAPAPAPLAARPVAAAKAPEGEKREPLQVRWPAADVKAMKRAALEADLSYSDYMLACFHAYNKS